MFALVALLAQAAVTGAAQPPTPATTPNAVPPAISWAIDPVHSEIDFRIRHLVGIVGGTFNEFSGTVTGTPPAWKDGTVLVEVKVASIDTRIQRRDDHLRSVTFFDVAKYPGMRFESKRVSIRNGNHLTIVGDLTLKGVTKPVVLTGTYLGEIITPLGRRVGFQVSAVIDRRDFGITWNQTLDDAGVTLGNEVEIELNIEAVPL